MIAVVFPLAFEVGAFRRALVGRRIERLGGVTIARGRVATREFAVAEGGVGAARCGARVGALLGAGGMDALIVAGFGGALRCGLDVGEIVVAENLTTPLLAARLTPDLAARLGVRPVRLISESRVVDDPAERERVGRERGADAVDMESEGVARVAAEHDVPLAVVRAISDSAVAPMPVPAAVLFDAGAGRPTPLALARHLLARPGRALALGRFALRAARLRTRLAQVLVEMAAAGVFDVSRA